MRVMFSKKLGNKEEEVDVCRGTGREGGKGLKANRKQEESERKEHLMTCRQLEIKSIKVGFTYKCISLYVFVCVVAVSFARRRVGSAVIRKEPQGGAAAQHHEYLHCGLP